MRIIRMAGRLFAGLIGLLAPSANALAQGTPTSGTARITVDPGPVSKAGFYVCFGTGNNREAYGSATTGNDGTVTYQHLPPGVWVQVTVVKAGYKGASAAAHTAAGAISAATLRVEPGTPIFSCPGYTPPPPATATRNLTVTVTEAGRPVSGAYVCVGSGTQLEKLARTRQTNSAGQVTFSDLPAGEAWAVIAGTAGRRGASALSAPHNANRTMNVFLSAGTAPVCPGTPPAPTLSVAVTTARPIASDPPPAPRQEYVMNGTVAWNHAKKYGFTFIPAKVQEMNASDVSVGFTELRLFGPSDGVATRLAERTGMGLPGDCVEVPNPVFGRYCILGQVVGGNMSVTPPVLSARTVEFEMFGGKRLSPGWTVKSVSVNNGTFVQQPQPGSDTPLFKLKLTAHKPNGATSIVQSIKLEGPANANPEDAFRYARN